MVCSVMTTFCFIHHVEFYKIYLNYSWYNNVIYVHKLISLLTRL